MRCTKCGGDCLRYGTAKRIVRRGGGESDILRIQRYKCRVCHYTFRDLPEEVDRFKQYSADVINGVKCGEIDSDILEYEDYPCELTMKRWKGTQN
jgi:hypothetical protein